MHAALRVIAWPLPAAFQNLISTGEIAPRVECGSVAAMMRWLRIALFLALGGAEMPGITGAEAVLRASKPEVKAEIMKVIDGQLAAFRDGDAARAYGYAAAELRAQKSLESFSGIVRENYPEIWGNRRGEPGIVRDDGRQATVTMHVYSKAGEAAYDFTLRKEKAGWRIFGVVRHAPRKGGTM